MDNIKLIRKSQAGDKQARDDLVLNNVGLVWSIVRRFINRGHDADDLFQIGIIGLIKAIDKFDLSYKVKLSTYAVPMIMGEIKRFLRDDGMIKVSRSLKENGGKIRRAREDLTYEFGREPTIEEICEKVDLTKEEVVMALESNTEVDSLNKTIYRGDGNSIYLIDKIQDGEENESELVIDKLDLKDTIESLDEKDQKIIKLRYFHNKTQTDIAKELGISQVQVSRLEKKILSKMRNKMINFD